MISAHIICSFFSLNNGNVSQMTEINTNKIAKIQFTRAKNRCSLTLFDIRKRENMKLYMIVKSPSEKVREDIKI